MRLRCRPAQPQLDWMRLLNRGGSFLYYVINWSAAQWDFGRRRAGKHEQARWALSRLACYAGRGVVPSKPSTWVPTVVHTM